MNESGETLLASPRPSNNNATVAKGYVDDLGGIKNLGNVVNPRINLNEANHFVFNLTANSNIGISNWVRAGKSSVIVVLRLICLQAF